MITVLKPYPATKNSNIKWLGEIPRHWEVLRLQNAVEIRISTEDIIDADGELLHAAEPEADYETIK